MCMVPRTASLLGMETKPDEHPEQGRAELHFPMSTQKEKHRGHKL